METWEDYMLKSNELKTTTTLNQLNDEIFTSNFEAGWWTSDDLKGRYPLENNKFDKPTATLIAAKIALIHSELSEALEGMRKGLMDDHLPSRTMLEVELADVQIRLGDLAGYLKLDLDGAVREKFNYNKQRLDHKLDNRQGAGGKTI